MHSSGLCGRQGFVEQSDVHSPALTVRESLQFSAECRLLVDDQKQLLEFVDEVPAWLCWAVTPGLRGPLACHHSCTELAT